MSESTLSLEMPNAIKSLDPGKSVVLLSGGLDSTTLLYLLKKGEGKDVIALGVDYGQRHSKELDAATAIASGLDIEYRIADLHRVSFCLMGGSQMDLSVSVPKGHYADPLMQQTVVPNRNMILLSLAIGLAISRGRKEVAYAAQAGDHTIYPDCRPEFISCMEAAACLAWYELVRLRAPFQQMTKDDIVRLGHDLGVPWELTYSCYEGGEIHCGTCGTCYERREAFHLAGVPDPTKYA